MHTRMHCSMVHTTDSMINSLKHETMCYISFKSSMLGDAISRQGLEF